MKFDINALIQKQKRPIKDKKQLSAELKKTIEQEEDPRIQKHKINALKKGYTPEEAEKIASICRSYYKSIDKMQAELSEKSMKIHEIFNEQSVKKGSWQQKYLTDFDKYVSKCRYCLNSGLDLPDEPLVSNHQFNWWFIISPPKGYCYCSPQRAVSQALLLARYKAVLLDSSACSFIYF